MAAAHTRELRAQDHAEATSEYEPRDSQPNGCTGLVSATNGKTNGTSTGNGKRKRASHAEPGSVAGSGSGLGPGLGLESSALTITPHHAVVEPQDAGLKAAGRKPSVSSLNPSTSRFTLRLPLLGRPKIPLEQAVASAQAEDVRGSSGSGSGDVVKQGGEGNGMCDVFPSVVGPVVCVCVLMDVACSF